MKYYKLDNITVSHGGLPEMKIDGKKIKPNGKLALEVIQLGDEITEEEYEAI